MGGRGELEEPAAEMKEGVVDRNLDSPVGYSPELLEKVSWDKGDDSVLGGDNLVGGIDMVLCDPVFLVVVVVGEVLVDKDGSGGPRLAFTGEQGLDVEGGELVVPDGDAEVALRRHGRLGERGGDTGRKEG